MDKQILVGTIAYLELLLRKYGPDASVQEVIEAELQK